MSGNLDHVAVSERGTAFKKFSTALIRTLQNPTKDEKTDVDAMNDRLRSLLEVAHGLRSKDLTIGDVQTTPVLQDLTVMYQNDEYIGTRIMPILTEDNGTGSALYWTYDKTNRYSAPDDRVSPRGQVNEVSENVTKTSTTLSVRSLKEFLDANVKSAMDAPVASLINPLMTVLDALAFNQELRIAAIAGTSTAFGSNTAAIAAADRWDTAGGGDPAGAVDTAKAALWTGNTPSMQIGAMSLSVYNVLKRHPQIREQFKYTGRETVSRAHLADYFELDEILVGRARKNTANEALTGSFSRIWPDVFGVFNVARVPAKKVATFGLTLATPITETEWYQPGIGGYGGWHTQAAFMDSSVVVCSDCGYLLTTPIG